ncbi:bifunctional helix-turn-helix transcriptional regulator/GNAT family N-acetyltransferase [Desulfuribacillus alkaliarsenatis]|uniref:MarR family transcriptional regulator n=1 Tax=Desulfuribacillus alkaliarsenatis TaxID=766136 RepID=A0A1E5G4N6_9FIRM|nr:helix-turn-helix domain-containing GNAT family N-acetyltransferase [Desulfuribacillus alkaliarsenatis]OEF98136.1 hypothetical protein BHF68_00130 [Desulfuribacillus alkaliarsenatis]
MKEQGRIVKHEHGIETNVIDDIRGFNRFYTDVLGLLNRHVLDSEYSLTESRILYEINKHPLCTANQLMSKLNLDRGHLSRILKQFHKQGLIAKHSSTTDGRKVNLKLTEIGKDILASLETSSSSQVQKLINHLTRAEQRSLAKSMRQIRSALLDGVEPITIRFFKDSNDIDYIVDKHRDIYGKEYGLGSEFISYVEKYIRQFQQTHNKEKEAVWIAETNSKVVGAIAAVMVDDSTVQLRWFLLEPEVRGRGLGQRLMNVAIEFCRDKGYEHAFLWTLDKLDTARHLYRKYGFTITETKENNTWAKNFTEERWDIKL